MHKTPTQQKYDIQPESTFYYIYLFIMYKHVTAHICYGITTMSENTQKYTNSTQGINSNH